MKIKLQTVIDVIEQVSDDFTMLYDAKSGQSVCLANV